MTAKNASKVDQARRVVEAQSFAKYRIVVVDKDNRRDNRELRFEFILDGEKGYYYSKELISGKNQSQSGSKYDYQKVSDIEDAYGLIAVINARRISQIGNTRFRIKSNYILALNSAERGEFLRARNICVARPAKTHFPWYA